MTRKCSDAGSVPAQYNIRTAELDALDAAVEGKQSKEGDGEMKNTLGDLNNHLFAQLEKLGDDDLTGEELESELRRADAICDISEQIIKNGELQYKAMKHMDEYGYERQKAVPELLEVHVGRLNNS